MPTSTELLLLQQKVSLLEGYMSWTIAGVTITITVLMAIFAVVQFVYQNKLERAEIQKIKKDIQDETTKSLATKEEILKLLIKTEIVKTEDQLKKRISILNADIARRFAIDCDKDGLFGNAFTWWLAAASDYASNDAKGLCDTSIKGARSSLEMIKDSVDIDILMEATADVNNNLTNLKEKYSIQAATLEDMFKKKLIAGPTKNF